MPPICTIDTSPHEPCSAVRSVRETRSRLRVESHKRDVHIARRHDRGQPKSRPLECVPRTYVARVGINDDPRRSLSEQTHREGAQKSRAMALGAKLRITDEQVHSAR